MCTIVTIITDIVIRLCYAALHLNRFTGTRCKPHANSFINIYYQHLNAGLTKQDSIPAYHSLSQLIVKMAAKTIPLRQSDYSVSETKLYLRAPVTLGQSVDKPRGYRGSPFTTRTPRAYPQIVIITTCLAYLSTYLSRNLGRLESSQWWSLGVSW